jgi:hypothetical protein
VSAELNELRKITLLLQEIKGELGCAGLPEFCDAVRKRLSDIEDAIGANDVADALREVLPLLPTSLQDEPRGDAPQANRRSGVSTRRSSAGSDSPPSRQNPVALKDTPASQQRRPLKISLKKAAK